MTLPWDGGRTRQSRRFRGGLRQSALRFRLPEPRRGYKRLSVTLPVACARCPTLFFRFHLVAQRPDLQAPVVSIPSTSETSQPPAVEDQTRWFAEEVRPHESSLRSYLRYSLTSLADVDDLMQECYVRLLRARNGGPIRSTRAFLFAVARNAVRDLLRRRAVADTVFLIRENDESCVLKDKANIVEFISHREELALLEEAICALPERCRQVFLLRKLEDMPQKEISAQLGIAEKTVEALVAKGARRCADYMHQYGVGGGSHHVR